MFDLESLPDFVVHAQFRLEADSPLPVNARMIGTIDLSGLHFYERPELLVAFSLILSATLQGAPGLVCRALDRRERVEPPLANDLALRYDIHRFLVIEIENVSGAELEFAPNAILTVAGIAASVTPSGFAPAPSAPAGIVGNGVRAINLDGVVLSQNWLDLTTDLATQEEVLGSSATRDVGTEPGTVAAGDDARFSRYDIAGGVQGKPASNAVIARFITPRAFSLPAALSGSQTIAGTPATATATFSICKNGIQFGTLAFTTSGATFSASAETAFSEGGVLTIVAPSTVDSTLSDIAFTLSGVML